MLIYFKVCSNSAYILSTQVRDTGPIVQSSVFFVVFFRPRKRKLCAEDVYKRQLEVLAVELTNKQLETKKLQIQIKLLERLDKKKEEVSAQEMLNSILLG